MTAVSELPTPTPDHELVWITPAVAAAMLEDCNTHNRTIRQDYVNKLADAITRDEWIVNGDSIKFAIDGTLLDGQHRLWACVMSERPILTIVVRDLDPASQQTHDTGLRRTLADTLRLNGVRATQATAAALSILYRQESGRVMSSDTPTIQQALEILERNPGLPGAAVRADAWRKHVHISAAVLAAVYHRAQDIDAEDADDFFNRLSSGADLAGDDPRFVLRRLVARKAMSRSIDPQWQIHALLIKAWNAYRQGRRITTLSFRPGGASPEKFPEMV